ncbi:MAG TPA: GH3 auxin-responsive promoter family protein, partial [Gemmataceae bacterium]|nr:GH3 auxin-responsive promoter family protein [Gemmataceae bacterium]
VLTTGGGLYRYCLRDEVEVVGFHERCPLLRFLGKMDRVSDLVGEKLAEVHVRGVLERTLAARGWAVRFALLVPVLGRPSHYALYLQGPGLGADTAALAADIQAGLEENPHYRYAVGLGQLATVEVRLLRADGPAAWRVYEAVCLERGQKLGDIKPAALDAWTGWPERFPNSWSAGVPPASELEPGSAGGTPALRRFRQREAISKRRADLTLARRSATVVRLDGSPLFFGLIEDASARRVKQCSHQ